MKRFWSDVRDIYGSAWAFAFACPLLFLIPVAFEFAQHVVEIQSGLYLSKEAARAAADDPGRMMFGYWKTLAISLPSYWFYRYVVSGRDADYARRLEPRAVLLWLALFLPFVAAANWLSLFGPPIGSVLGLHGDAVTWGGRIATLVETVIGIYLTAWMVAWSQGNTALGPLNSARIMNGFFWRTVSLIFAGTVPLMALHYGGLFAIGQSQPVVWVIMTFDSLVVGFLALTLFGANAVAAMRAASAKGVSLLRADDRRSIGTTAPA